jgi:predicted Fe-S protein YdhL (DUF1289 family)
MIESPCIRVCTLDAAGELCLGCFRTLEEIGLWASLTDAQRFQVLDRLPARRRAREAAGPDAGTMGKAVRCERCGAGFVCGVDDPGRECWCTTYPPLTPASVDARCLCPACLAASSAT